MFVSTHWMIVRIGQISFDKRNCDYSVMLEVQLSISHIKDAVDSIEFGLLFRVWH
jgi:hypothetical protein